MIYAQVADYLYNQQDSIIPLAIYRKKEILDNTENYVYTNPNPQSPILSGDMIIVIGRMQTAQREEEQKFPGNLANAGNRSLARELNLGRAVSRNENVDKSYAISEKITYLLEYGERLASLSEE